MILPSIPSRAALAILAAVTASPAFAHTGVDSVHGFAAGLAHPMVGADHVLAMVAVGLWAGLIGGRALWAWPAAFVGVMAIGGAIGMAGLGLPWVEAGIGLSVVALGLLVALKAPAPLAVGAALCGAFALFHGHAHGAELPHGMGGITYAAGFLLATAALHAAGIGLALGLARFATPMLTRAAGGAVALAGLALLAG